MQLFSVFLVIALVVLLISRQVKKAIIFIIWILVAYFIRSLLPNKFYYYTLSYLPAVAFLTALGLLVIKVKFLRHASVAVLLLLGVNQYVKFSFFSPLLLSPVLQAASYTPRIYDSKAVKMVNRILEELKYPSVTIGVWHIDGNDAHQNKVVVGNWGVLLNMHMLQYEFELQGMTCEVIDLTQTATRFDGTLPEFIIAPCAFDDFEMDFFPKGDYRLIDIFELADFSKVHLYRLVGKSTEEIKVKVHHPDYAIGSRPHEFNEHMLSRLRRVVTPINALYIYWKGTLLPTSSSVSCLIYSKVREVFKPILLLLRGYS